MGYIQRVLLSNPLSKSTVGTTASQGVLVGDENGLQLLMITGHNGERTLFKVHEKATAIGEIDSRLHGAMIAHETPGIAVEELMDEIEAVAESAAVSAFTLR